MDDPLAALYPGLAPAGARGTPVDDATLLASIEAKGAESVRTKQAFLVSAGPTLARMARALADTFRGGGRLLVMGNGGSACDAAHVATEFNHPVTVGRPPLPAWHLGADAPMMLAVGNDVGFEHVFTRQVLSHGRKGDALLGLSTSGNSANLLAAFRRARMDGLRTLGLTGGDGGRMATSPDVEVCAVVPSSSIHRVQECHVLAYHVLWDLVHTLLADDRGPVRGGEAT